METGEINFTDKLINGLKNAAIELEELRVQIALGKSEAKDVFEDLKKQFNGRLNHLKADYHKIVNSSELAPVMAALERVQAQLSHGIAATSEMFEEQLSNIRRELNSLESELSKSVNLHHHTATFHLEIEKFKAKLELLSLHFKLNNVIAGYQFEEKKKEFQHKMQEIKIKMMEKEQQARSNWRFFKQEMDEAYDHLKKAFVH